MRFDLAGPGASVGFVGGLVEHAVAVGVGGNHPVTGLTTGGGIDAGAGFEHGEWLLAVRAAAVGHRVSSKTEEHWRRPERTTKTNPRVRRFCASACAEKACLRQRHRPPSAGSRRGYPIVDNPLKVATRVRIPLGLLATGEPPLSVGGSLTVEQVGAENDYHQS